MLIQIDDKIIINTNNITHMELTQINYSNMELAPTEPYISKIYFGEKDVIGCFIKLEDFIDKMGGMT